MQTENGHFGTASERSAVSELPGRPTGRLDRRDAQLPTAQAPPTQAAPDPSGRRGEQTFSAGTGRPDRGRVNISPGPGWAPDCQRLTPRRDASTSGRACMNL